MNDSKRKLLDRIFSHALSLTGEERDRYILLECRDNPWLRTEIGELLDAAEQPDHELATKFSVARDQLWRDVLAGEEASEEDLSGHRIGPWRIVCRVARGGLATVYRASRDDGQFDQTVAFKVLRRGLDTDDLVARFRAERQIL